MVKGHGLDDTRLTLSEHLGELRSRLLKSLIAVVVTGGASFAFAPEILDYATAPLTRVLADGNRIDTLLVTKDATVGAELASRLGTHSRVRFRGLVESLDVAAKQIAAGIDEKKPIDLLLVSADLADFDDGALSAALERSEPSPSLVYLVRDVKSSAVAELELDGATVLLERPKNAALHRVIARAGAVAGKNLRDGKLVVLSPFDTFFAYLKIAIVCGLFLACPIWLYQAWRFIAPGLYTKEKHVIVPAILGASFMFVAGGLFAYYAMFPVMFRVLITEMMPASVAASFTVDKYLGLIVQMVLAFGVVFETPLIIALLARVGIVHPDRLRKWRKHAIVLSFIIGAIFTPADPISQIMMSIPLVVFYEIGIVLASLMAKRREATAASSA